MSDQEQPPTPTPDSTNTTPDKPKRAPPKLGKKSPAKQEQTPPSSEQDQDKQQEEPAKQQEPDSEPEPEPEPEQQEDEAEPEPEPEPQPKPERRRRRPRPRPQESDTESIARSEMEPEQKPQRRVRRQRQPQQQQQQQSGSALGGLPGVGGGDQAGQLVQNTAGNAVNGATDSAGKAVGGILGSGEKKEEEDGGRDEQLRLRLDLNLDIEVQLKAKIHGDLTIGLLWVFPFFSYTHLSCVPSHLTLAFLPPPLLKLDSTITVGAFSLTDHLVINPAARKIERSIRLTSISAYSYLISMNTWDLLYGCIGCVYGYLQWLVYGLCYGDARCMGWFFIFTLFFIFHVYFLFFLVFLVCSEVISLDLASAVVSLRCTVPLAFSLTKYLGLENWDNELGFCVIILFIVMRRLEEVLSKYQGREREFPRPCIEPS